MNEVERLRRKLEREKAARKQAESILENKALELYEANQKLIAIRDSQQLELDKRIQEIQNKERVYRNFVENASDLIFTCDIHGTIIYANSKMIKLSGYPKSEIVGANFQKFVPENYRVKVRNFYAFQLSEKLDSTYIEFPVLDANGKEVWLGQTADLAIGDQIMFNVLARDISDRKRLEKSLMISEEKYRSIIENMELGLLEVDRDGIILKAYPKFCKLTGYSNKELVGKDSVTTFLFEEDQKDMIRRNKDRLNGESGAYEIRLRRKDGSFCWVLVSGAPYYNEKGQVAGSIGIHLDITSRKSMEQELLGAKKVAESSLKAKDIFLANISHEIRTPLNAIIGISELMLRSELDELQQKYLETIMSSGDNLLELINEILDLSKIQSGKLVLREDTVNLTKLLDHIYTSFKVIASKKSISIEYESNLEPNEFYLLDGTRLKEIMFNLVGNAVKFTDSGFVRIKVTLERSQDGFDTFGFSVHDSGIGIPKEDLQNIFSSFEQASNTPQNGSGGTGLGLSITKGIIQSMGGDLHVESTVGKGSKFQFKVVFQRAQEVITEGGADILPEEFEFLSGKRILVVDDARVNRFLIQNILENWGVSYSEATDGLNAIELVRKESFDLIFMDIRMPGLNGMETTKKIREELNNTEVPIVALTANAIQGEKEKYIESGMNDYLTKPFTQRGILNKLSEYLNSESRLESNVPEKIELINRKGITSLSHGDPEFQNRMVQLFMEETKIYIEELENFMASENIEGIEDIAHSLKGAVAHICSPEILTKVKQVELAKVPTDEKIRAAREMINYLEFCMEDLRNEFSI